MLSVAKLTPGQESYYERSVAAGLDDYYAGRGESPGVWTGRGAAILGLEGVVQDRQLGTLIRGVHPLTEERLRKHPKERTITIERIDPHADERRIEQKKLSPVAGFDLVFSTPKSVSLLHALGDEGTRRAVNEAHAAAWQAALEYLEDEACVTRRGKNGFIREHGGGFVAAAYQHRTSRAQDPHLHTHVIVANMTQSPSDAKWRALDGEAILKTYRLAAGYLYEAHLRAELARTLGVDWEKPRKGWAELKGVPRRVIEEFSTRRLAVVERMREQATSGFYAAQVAAVGTRERKEQVDLVVLREDWRARAAEHGLGQRELRSIMGQSIRQEPSARELQAIVRRLLGPLGLTEKRTAFAGPELAMAWAEALPRGAAVSKIRRLCERFVAIDGVARVGEAPAPGRPARYSTSELMQLERSALELVDRGADSDAPALDDGILDNSLPDQLRERLSREQRAMVGKVATSRDRVVCVVGVAGAGKTTAAHALATAFASSGIDVVGAAPSGVAAEKLQDETGIPSTTLHRFLERAQGGELPHRCVLIVDEAGMAETRVLAPVLEQVKRVGGKVVLIGDPYQLPAVGAGGLFAGIVERKGAVVLHENRRQRDELERVALAKIRAGVGREYLAFAEQRERLVVSEDPLATRMRLVADWWSHARSDLGGNVMIALRRRDVAELNALARGLMETNGKLGRERVIAAGREFASGDRIVCLRNSDHLGVKNGTRGTIERLDKANGTLSVATDRGDRVELSRQYLEAGHVRHAYALTGHSGQGVTVDRAFVLGSGDARLQEWGYVALSRARDATRLYVTASTFERESDFHEHDDRDPVARLASSLEESAVERLAVDQRPYESGPRHALPAEIDRAAPSARASAQLRLVEQERLVLQRTRDEAAKCLEQIESRTARPRLRGRQRKDELRREAQECRTTVRVTTERLEELEGRSVRFRARAAEQPVAETPSMRPSRSLDLGL
ncbi:MAG TPA: MobF family relaxase [Gaiellaceae bacterium]|nr:MobF family relaxase [Gaiellaceae bacterium]